MGHSIDHRAMARKKDERYDAKMAYDKNLSGKARLHYLENDIHDKGMSMKSGMHMESAKQERKNLLNINPVVNRGTFMSKHSSALNMDHDSPMEANAFYAALNAAKESGKDTFKVGGKTFNVKGGSAAAMYDSPASKHCY